MKNAHESPAKPRTAYLDNLRIFLTVLVIVHHASIAFGGGGSWAVDDPNADTLSEVILTYFTAVNQTFFMSLFFLLAGYFTPRSLAKKGWASYLLDRLVRLGIPLLVYTTIIININSFIVNVLWLGQPMEWLWMYNPGHLWFLQALLLFAIVYVLYRQALYKDPEESRFHIYRDRFPPNGVILACIPVLVILTFAMRLVTPVGEWLYGFQWAHFPHYIFSFIAGVLAYRGDWLNRLDRTQARRWGIVALVTIPMFLVLVFAGGALEGDEALARFLGGPYWQALALATWETILFFAISIFLLYYFRERLNWSNKFLAVQAASVYTVYIIHQTLVIWVDTWFIPLDLPMLVKFACVALISVPLCFGLAYLIRKIPGVDRVVG